MAAAEEAAPTADAISQSPSSSAATANGGGAERQENWVEDLQRSVIQSKDSAIRSARSFQQNSSSHLRSLQQEQVPQAISLFKTYQDAFFNKAKEVLMRGIEQPAPAIGIAVTASLILMRGPRRFLFRHTLGRFQSEEAQFFRAEKNVKGFEASVNLVKMESKKLLERASFAEKDMKLGHTELMKTGSQIQHLAKSTYKLENQAQDLMDGLREVPGREALKLRAEVASMASLLKKRRIELDKRIMKISDLGVPV